MSVAAHSRSPIAVAWHDAECGGYARRPAALGATWPTTARAPVLDLGAGTGRVSLQLARRRPRAWSPSIATPTCSPTLSSRAPTGLPARLTTLAGDVRRSTLPTEAASA